jgi:hypothetical protein
MSEKPILFSAPMIRALLAETKTQTRRPVKWRGLEPGLNLQFSGLSVERCGSHFVLTSPTRDSYAHRSVPQPCPYGNPGDTLWVRETWTGCWGPLLKHRPFGKLVTDGAFRQRGGEISYATDQCPLQVFYAADDEARPLDHLKWRPSIHMPRAASRITLEITGVRVERLNDISEVDAIDEGIGEFIGGWACLTDDAPQQAGATPQQGYRYLWERINGAGSWDANPWVWCVSFRRVTP